MVRSYRCGKSEPRCAELFVWWIDDLGFLRWWFSVGAEFSSTEEISLMYGFDSTPNQTKPSPHLIEVLFVSRGDSSKKQRHSLWLRYELYNLIFVQILKYILAILLIDLVFDFFFLFIFEFLFCFLYHIFKSDLSSILLWWGVSEDSEIRHVARKDSSSINTPNMSLDVLHATCIQMYTNSMWVWMCTTKQHGFKCAQPNNIPNNMSCDVQSPTTCVRMCIAQQNWFWHAQPNNIDSDVQSPTTWVLMCTT